MAMFLPLQPVPVLTLRTVAFEDARREARTVVIIRSFMVDGIGCQIIERVKDECLLRKDLSWLQLASLYLS